MPSLVYQGCKTWQENARKNTCRHPWEYHMYLHTIHPSQPSVHLHSFMKRIKPTHLPNYYKSPLFCLRRKFMKLVFVSLILIFLSVVWVKKGFISRYFSELDLLQRVVSFSFHDFPAALERRWTPDTAPYPSPQRPVCVCLFHLGRKRFLVWPTLSTFFLFWRAGRAPVCATAIVRAHVLSRAPSDHHDWRESTKPWVRLKKFSSLIRYGLAAAKVSSQEKPNKEISWRNFM